MSLRSELARVWRPSPLATASPKLVKTAIADIERLWGERPPRQPEPFALGKIHRAIWTSWHGPAKLQDVGRHDLKWLPYVVYRPLDGAPCLAADPDFAREFLAFLDAETRRLPPALWVTLRDYPASMPTFPVLLTGLAGKLLSSRVWSARVWQQRHENYRLFDPAGPEALAESLLKVGGSKVEDILAGAGLIGDLSSGGFIRAVHRQLLAKLTNSPQRGMLEANVLTRPFEFMEVDRHKLKLEDMAAEIADALLVPCSGQATHPATRHSIQDFLLRHLDDPRVFPQKWQRVSDEGRAVMLRWLVEATLEDFFRLIGRYAWMPHWQYRHAFWHAYFRAGVISDACVVLGDEARAAARDVFRQQAVQFGRFSGGAQRDHSVLLLRIGNLVVAEWSHNGACRVWDADDSIAPKLHELRYDGTQLKTGADHEQRHHASETYTWQRQLADYIRRETGIVVYQRDYRLQ